MRLSLLPCLALVPCLAIAADAHDHAHDHDHAHASLGAHEHGVSRLDLALEGDRLMVSLDSPAANFLGFEHAPQGADEEAKVAKARERLEQPQVWLGLASAAGCKTIEQDIDGPGLGAHAGADEHEHETQAADPDGHEAHGAHEGHSDIEASYTLQCAAPQALTGIDLSTLFNDFPGTVRVLVQLIGPSGQAGAELTADSPQLGF